MTTEEAIHHILVNIGEDVTREGLVETPVRVSKAYKEIFSGYKIEPESLIKCFDAEGYKDLILVRDIKFFSMCEHHMLPFHGTANVAYLPNTKITGLSKVPRVVEAFSKRLQNQERITKQVADTFEKVLKPKGVAVQLSGVHGCMCGRGVMQREAQMVTTTFRGDFEGNLELQNQFFGQI